ncbi:MAG: hypothetical protein RLY97_1782, partial [Pseudomonadota bacterium]
MPRVIDVADDGVIGLDECSDAMAMHGFDPANEESLAHAALMLRRLGNNAHFLGDILIEELAGRHSDVRDASAYGPQVIMLARPETGNCFLRANIWPSRDEPMMRASGAGAFVFGLAHDHNFSFLTHGYFGPGYESEFYEYDFDSVVGYRGEKVDLRYMGRETLSPGKIMLYRAHRDIHAQMPATALSVSLNIMHTSGAQAWHDQYGFDTEKGEIKSLLSHGASEAFLRIAVGLGGDEARDLASRFAATHPSDRMRM